MATYYDYVFGCASDIYDVLENGFGYYSKDEFLCLLHQAKLEHAAVLEENDKLKKEIATMNTNIVASLERDLFKMRSQINTVIKPKYVKTKTVEELDV